MRCQRCRKAYWRSEEPCSLDIIQEPARLDPRDPEVKRRRLASYMEVSGIADEVMTVSEAKVLLKVLSSEYDDDPLRFLPYGKEEE